ncbi:MAG: NAD-dependent epimerase/dehydratase family protein [Methanoregula sp.]|jgi:GDP-L-fucose synthase|uniref:NAD-dependent epimerase/dehydratase family protein n=1 Tax=Methanoregula sp. TaxID=2052170 RepID=UPI003D0B06ED
MKNDKKTVFITGSTGFIGKNIVEHLKDNYILLTPPHKDLNLFFQKDVRTFFLRNEIDCVIHCANFGGTRKTPGVGEVIEKNMRMFFNLAENQDRFQTLIHMGSGGEYNKCRDIQKIPEEEFGSQIPTEEHGFSKYLISKYIEQTENMYCLRLFGIFGKYEDYEFKFVSNAIIKNLLSMPITIRQNVYFNWLYIEDFFKILDYFLTHKPKYPSYNITTPDPIDLVSISELINSISDFKSEIIVENEGLNYEYSGSNTRLSEEIPGLTFTPMKSALKDLIRYYQKILPEIDPDTIRKDAYAASCKINPILNKES